MTATITTGTNNASDATSTVTAAQSVATHTVDVGKATNKFEPQILQAAVGDLVIFKMYPLNHTVTEADFGYPCIPSGYIGSDKAGFFSGYHPVQEILDDPPTWNLTINSTEPIFYYCSAIGSCIDYGMVGAINPNSSQTFAAQQQLAYSADYMVAPGQQIPAEGSSSTSVVAVSATSTRLASATGESETSAADGVLSRKPSSLSKADITGIVIGVLGMITAFALLAWLWRLRRTTRRGQFDHPKFRAPQISEIDSGRTQPLCLVSKQSPYAMANARAAPCSPESPFSPLSNNSHIMTHPALRM